MIDPFPLPCQRCAQVTWMGVDFYKENGEAHLKDLCPHCDYSKYKSLHRLSEVSDFYFSKFIAVDFLLAMENMH